MSTALALQHLLPIALAAYAAAGVTVAAVVALVRGLWGHAEGRAGALMTVAVWPATVAYVAGGFVYLAIRKIFRRT